MVLRLSSLRQQLGNDRKDVLLSPLLRFVYLLACARAGEQVMIIGKRIGLQCGKHAYALSKLLLSAA